MRIGEVMKRSGLSKKAVHYYVNEGLLYPRQDSNDYYDFSEEDLRRLEVIQKLRYLDFSVDTIKSVLENPSVAFYYFLTQRKEYQKELSRLNWKLSNISELMEFLGTDTTFDSLANNLAVKIKEYPDAAGSRAVDENDAELLAYFFWGRVVGKSSMTEYQKYLWEKLKKTIVITQTEYTQKLRDSLYQFQKVHVSKEFIDPDFNEAKFSKIAGFAEDDFTAYADLLIKNAWKHLKDPVWIQSWKQNRAYLTYAGIFFDSEASTIMRELSPTYGRYQKNINRIGDILGAYLKSEEGKSLLKAIYNNLSEDLDLFSNHHSILIGICA